MDIKSLVRTVLPFSPVGPAAGAKQRAQTVETTDRDPHGKQEQAEEQPKRHLTQQEIDDAIAYLKSLAGVKENNLIIRLEEHDGIKVIFVEEPGGKVVRRLAEADLFVLLKSKAAPEPKKSGNLLNKAV